MLIPIVYSVLQHLTSALYSSHSTQAEYFTLVQRLRRCSSLVWMAELDENLLSREIRVCTYYFSEWRAGVSTQAF